VSYNRLPYSFAICLLVILLLFVLSFIPEFKIGNWKFKRIDVLADIHEQPLDTLLAVDTLTTDSIQAKINSVVKASQSTCKKGITCIEDYSNDSTAMKDFLHALHNLKEKGNTTLRIAMYGDSFIEGDVFCGSLRDTLQAAFGGSGVGYVPITSEVAGFRTTIKHQFENFKTHSLMSKKDSTGVAEFGPVGFCFLPQEGNWVEYKPSYLRNLKEFNVIRLFYKNKNDSATVDYTINDTLTYSEPLKTSRRLQQWTHKGEHIKSVKFEFPVFDSLKLYGASFEDYSGICVDNFSMRGNSGIGLLRISDNMFTEFNSFRNYKLIILQYGLNVVLEDSLHYGWYAARMIKVVNKIKQAYPHASILMMSVSDRSSNTSGTFKTMKAIPALRNAQRLVAQRTGVAFWDLFEAMGGEGSMVKLVEGKPSLAAKDYTHLTFKGGRKLARLLMNSLLYEQEKYERKKKK